MWDVKEGVAVVSTPMELEFYMNYVGCKGNKLGTWISITFKVLYELCGM